MLRKKLCFISHCSTDKEKFGDKLVKALRDNYNADEYAFFYSSDPDNTTVLGDKVSNGIPDELVNADLMIAVITNSYLRSVIATAEMGYFWGSKKTVIPLVFSEESKRYYKDDLTGDGIYLNLFDSFNPEEQAKIFVSSMETNEYKAEDKEKAIESFTHLFTDITLDKPNRGYIGSGDEYEHINKYCEDFGVKRLKNERLDTKEFIEKITGCKELYILATTGERLIQALCDKYLTNALANGMNLTVLIPNRNSSFVYDVAEIESTNTEEKIKALDGELDTVLRDLKDCLNKAHSITTKKSGDVYIGCSYTLIRQTITLAVWEDKLWGWLSMTIPPKHAADGTPSIEFEAPIDEKNSFGYLIYEHVKSVQTIAQQRKSFFRLSEFPDFQEFFLENEGAKQYWLKLYDQAIHNTRYNNDNYESELIEVAAQHPLKPDGSPGKEFEQRLLFAIELYQKIKKEGKEVRIFVPGSVHCYKGKQDPCSLSEAGKSFLVKNGIPGKDILGEEENNRYKGDKGVYNTADECYVAAQIFFNEDYRRLHCVCSSNQILRKKLFYIAFGVIPLYHTVSTENMAHNDINELFDLIPDIISRDHTWQGENSVQGNRTRRERQPVSDGK